jgi:chromosome segregation ATPase
MPDKTFGMNGFLALLTVLSLVAGSASAFAQSDNKKGGKDREMARRVQQLQKEKGELSNKLKGLEDKTEELTKAADSAAQEAASKSQALSGLKKQSTARITSLETELTEVKRKLDETSTQLARRESEKRLLEGVAAEQVDVMGRQGKLIEICHNDNAKLYQYGKELLQKYKNDGDSSFNPIDLGKVDSFNIYQESLDKIDKLKIASPQLAH